ncbi:MAG: c-type cytochrome [Phycisphaerales bacterium]|nr:c-type cytochrome [Phycisphaerales bacterium]
MNRQGLGRIRLPDHGWGCAVGVMLATMAISACVANVAKLEGAPDEAPPSVDLRSDTAVEKSHQVRNASSDGVANSPKSKAAEADRAAPGEGQAAAAASSADPLAARGATLFAKYCSICHGDQGDGAGKFAYLMNPRPRNLQQGNFKLATTRNQIPSDDDLLQTISRGMPGSAMPPWGHLPATDLRALVTLVRQLHVGGARTELEKWVAEGTIKTEELADALAERTQSEAPLVVPPEPAFDDVHWFRGRRTYLEGCATCHGESGHPVAEAVKYDNEGYPVPPRSFVNGIFKGGDEGHQLYARIVKGLKGTPMPGYGSVYNDEEMWDLIHYVQSLSRQGAQERARLQQRTIVAPNIRGPLPSEPMAPEWEQARAVYVALTPLWWTEDRVEGLTVQALHNDDELAFRLVWIDAAPDERAVRQDEFRDGVAIQFSLSSDPPFYMGDTGEHGGVNIWFWKADRQKNIKDGYQDVDAAFPDRAVDRYPEQRVTTSAMAVWPLPPATITEHDAQFITAWGAGNLVADPELTTPVECLVARGPGTLAGKPSNVQMVQGEAVHHRGVWYVQMQRSLALPHAHEDADERAFDAGDYLPVSFAIWNGGAGDRDGKKNISIWQKLVIE